MTVSELYDYLVPQNGYGWHISDLVIYDKPKGLWEFCKPCERQAGCDCRFCKSHFGNKPIVSAPQSWCYVEVWQNGIGVYRWWIGEDINQIGMFDYEYEALYEDIKRGSV